MRPASHNPCRRRHSMKLSASALWIPDRSSVLFRHCHESAIPIPADFYGENPHGSVIWYGPGRPRTREDAPRPVEEVVGGQHAGTGSLDQMGGAARPPSCATSRVSEGSLRRRLRGAASRTS